MATIKKEYSCSLILTNDLIGGKWKGRILWHIIQGDNRFSLLQKTIPEITHKVLITQLRELENSGILSRKEIDDVRPHVVYSISNDYAQLIPILESLCDFTKQYAEKTKLKSQIR